MPLPLLVALVLATDPAVAMARAEARVRKVPIAIPILEGSAPVRSREVWDGFLRRNADRLEDVPEGLARKDRPLLISPRSYYLDLELRGLPLLGPAARGLERAAAEGVVSEDGRFSVPMANLTETDQATIQQTGLTAPSSDRDDPTQRFLNFVPNPQVMFRTPEGKTYGFSVRGKSTPYDPTAILAKLKFQDPDPVPEALRTAVQGRWIVAPETPLTLAAWSNLLADGKLELRVDARAKAWKAALGARGSQVSAADALRAIARAHRLYWRPVGDGWILAASPGEPRPFSIAILKAKGMEELAKILERLARAGAVPQDFLALMVENNQPVKQLGTQNIQRVRRLMAVGKVWPQDTGQLERLLSSPGIADATLSVNIAMSISVVGTGGSNGIGVTLP